MQWTGWRISWHTVALSLGAAHCWVKQLHSNWGKNGENISNAPDVLYFNSTWRGLLYAMVHGYYVTVMSLLSKNHFGLRVFRVRRQGAAALYLTCFDLCWHYFGPRFPMFPATNSWHDWHDTFFGDSTERTSAFKLYVGLLPSLTSDTKL